MSKRVTSPYVSGRNTHWLKSKVAATADYIVTGYAGDVESLVLAELSAEGSDVGQVELGAPRARLERPCSVALDRDRGADTRRGHPCTATRARERAPFRADRERQATIACVGLLASG